MCSNVWRRAISHKGAGVTPKYESYWESQDDGDRINLPLLEGKLCFPIRRNVCARVFSYCIAMCNQYLSITGGKNA